MKHSGVINLRYISTLADDIRFHQDLFKASILDKQIFFDTSSIIDILLGVEGIIKGNQFKRTQFNMHSTLLYAMTYRNWLGEICTLPTHTDELVNKIQLSKHLLRDTQNPNSKLFENELWGSLGIRKQDLQVFGETRDIMQERFNQMKIDSVDVFKATYLLSENGFWKHRYRYLREQKTVNFYPVSDLNIKEITQSEVYLRLKSFFNKNRYGHRSLNNYVDVLALCFLDKELRAFENKETGKSKLPIFFSDQEIVLDAIEMVSQTKDEYGRYPFTWTSTEGRSHRVVRSANFFIIEGIFNIKKEEDQHEIISKFTEALEEYRRTLENYANATSSGSILNFKDKFQKETLNVIFLEFFNRWRMEFGNDQMLKLISYDNYQILDKEIDIYILEERERLKEEFAMDSGRFQLVKKMWEALANLPGLVRRVFNSYSSYVVAKEIDPRFAFKEDICNEIQDEVDELFQSIQRDDSVLLEEVGSRLVDSVLIGLYDKNMSDEKRNNELCKVLGILWIFESFDLISDICYEVHNQYKHGAFGKSRISDEYPIPSIALMHAAAIIQGSSKNQNECMRILNCVHSKFSDNNYQIWIGLSYIYFILWNEVVSSYDFYELAKIYGKRTPDYAKDYLKKAGMNACRAMTWLAEERFNIEKMDCQKRRQRRYYYALNNYLFYITIASSAEDFVKSKNIAKELEDAMYAPDYWQVRFGDTLARYYYRSAFISETESEFDLYLKWAVEFNKQAIKSSQRVRDYYLNLEKDLEELKGRGFTKNYRYRFSPGGGLELSFH